MNRRVSPVRRSAQEASYWIFGLHAVRSALLNERRKKRRLIATRNAGNKLKDAIKASGMAAEIADPRRFPVPLDSGSVHQGAALEVFPLEWGSTPEICGKADENHLVLVLDRVTDPHNVGAILRSAEAFGARAVISPSRHSPPETGALAKSASGALERVPYIRIGNLATELTLLRNMGYAVIGLDAQGPLSLSETLHAHASRPLALVLGSEGVGLRALTKASCDCLANISAVLAGSINVSNAAAISLYAATNNRAATAASAKTI